jgi:SET domain-containing protein
MRIYPPNKIYISKSTVHGYGIFANQIIDANEIIEECPIYDLKIKKGEMSPLMNDYRFNWPQGMGSEWEKQVLAWGYGSLYNHSENANAYWRSNLENETFEFVSNRRIEKDEEIFVWYGGVSYWQDGRTNTIVI